MRRRGGVQPSSRAVAEAPRPSRYGRRRAAVLAGVYVMFLAHYVHWKVSGRTLAPLEFNEVMVTLEEGIITAGFLFMAVAFLSAAVFGRFFCSWGCHILALEDLCSWLLRKVRIRPRPVRSRTLFLVPLGIMLYMFVWPQARNLVVSIFPATAEVLGAPVEFELRVASDGDGWASFTTVDFWRNLPGPGIAILTFLVCGFAIVYLLGSRSFCTYVCPYGAVFRLADRVAVGRIKLTGDCTQCGACTARCGSQVRVHEEVARYGSVVNPACLKDLDCVGGCPQQALSYGFTTPAFGARKLDARRNPVRDFTRAEEAGLATVFVASMVVFTGLPGRMFPWAGRLYGVMPLFLSAGLAVLTAFLTLLTWRLVRRRTVRLHGIGLKSAGRLKRPGVVFIALTGAWLLFVTHAGLVQYHMFQAGRVIERTRHLSAAALAQDGAVLEHLDRETREGLESAERHLREAAALGMFADVRISRQRAWLCLLRGDSRAAERHLRDAIDQQSDHPDSYYQLGRVLAVRGDATAAVRMLARAEDLSTEASRFRDAIADAAKQLELLGLHGQAAAMLGEFVRIRGGETLLEESLARALRRSGRIEEAVEVLRARLLRAPDQGRLRVTLARWLWDAGAIPESLAELRRVIRDEPDDPDANALLGRGLLHVRRLPKEAIPYLKRAVDLLQGAPRVRADLAQAYLSVGEFDLAEVQIRANLRRPETRAGSLYSLGELRRAQGRLGEAREFFRQAHAADPSFPEPGR